jgi:hypothetical protein
MDIHTPSDYTNPFDPERLAVLGRPLWCTVAYESHTFDATMMVQFAKEKLMCSNGEPLSVLLKHEQEAARFTAAILGVCVDLEIQSADLAKDLVASHMRILSYLSSDCLLAFTEYLSEPILAEAAAQLMESHEYALCVNLVAMIHNAHVAAGDVGQLVAELILLHAFDVACRGNRGPFKYSQPITLKQFLVALFPHYFKDPDQGAGLDSKYKKTWKQLLAGTVCLTHWIKVSGYFPNLHQLHDFYHQCAGIIAKDNEETLDLVIPVALSKDKISLVAIQVKN